MPLTLQTLNHGQAPAIRGTLPGFSGFEDDEDTDHQDKGKRKDDIIDLAVRAAKMQKDKTEILENFSALANSLGNVRNVEKGTCSGGLVDYSLVYDKHRMTVFWRFRG